jgi:biopolymer transport protein ExbB/TolQ
MKKTSNNTSGDFERKKLDVDLLTVSVIALLITLAIYLIVFPFKTSFIGILLYDRGPTQHLAIYFASIVATLNFLKFTKLQKEFKALKNFWIPETIQLDAPNAKEIVQVQKTLAKDGRLIAIRCSRIIAAYIQSGNRKAASELALDDSSFYVSASESSYTFPRILIWAIPLLGFIGTVFGISEAVNGFSGLLEKAADVEQIKEGIGTVTTGLAIAFDTTLLALFLSVLVMIPLVAIERFESRLLLGIDVYINDHLLPRFKDKTDLDEQAIDRAIDKAIKEHLPAPEALVQPAHEYARKAATSLAQNFVSEVSKLQEVSSKLIEQIGQVNRMALEDRHSYTTALETQKNTNQNLIVEIRGIVEAVKGNHADVLEKQKETHQNLLTEIRGIIDAVKATHAEISTGFVGQTQQISDRLERASQMLGNRIAYLEKAAIQLSEINQLTKSIEQVLASLEQARYLNQALTEVRESLIQLKPALEKMSKPRIITFVDSEE